MTDREKQREKLIELMRYGMDKNFMLKFEAEIIADHLIANGVTFATDTNDGGKWISVKDRLPNVDTNKSGYERKGVIVCIDGSFTKSVYRVYERACNRGKTVYRWKYPWDTISDENITHWYELPQPPKGE